MVESAFGNTLSNLNKTINYDKSLITGTRYMNMVRMPSIENEAAIYVQEMENTFSIGSRLFLTADLVVGKCRWRRVRPAMSDTDHLEYTMGKN